MSRVSTEGVYPDLCICKGVLQVWCIDEVVYIGWLICDGVYQARCIDEAFYRGWYICEGVFVRVMHWLGYTLTVVNCCD